MQRYFVSNKINNKLILENNDIHHIKNVMRMSINDKIEVVYRQKVYICNIDKLDKNNIDISIINELNENNELNVDITIAFALSKEEKIDYILQKCTELGIKEFIPLELSRCNIKINSDKKSKKIERWQLICKEAAEQSKRNTIPKVNNIGNIDNILNLNYDLKIVCSVKQSVINIKEVLQNNPNCDRIIFVIGPEGGITDKEENILINNGFIATSLGKRILRMETAPVFIGSVLNYFYMR